MFVYVGRNQNLKDLKDLGGASRRMAIAAIAARADEGEEVRRERGVEQERPAQHLLVHVHHLLCVSALRFAACSLGLGFGVRGVEAEGVRFGSDVFELWVWIWVQGFVFEGLQPLAGPVATSPGHHPSSARAPSAARASKRASLMAPPRRCPPRTKMRPPAPPTKIRPPRTRR